MHASLGSLPASVASLGPFPVLQTRDQRCHLPELTRKQGQGLRVAVAGMSSLEMAREERGSRRRMEEEAARGGACRHALIKGFVTSSAMCQDDSQSSR